MPLAPRGLLAVAGSFLFPDGSVAADHMPCDDGHASVEVLELGSSDDSDSGVVTLTRMGGVVVCGNPPIPAYLDGTLRDDFLEGFSPGRISPHVTELGLRAGLYVDTLCGSVDHDLGRSRVYAWLFRELECRRPRVAFTCAP